jgi:hypothetical protein
MHNGIDVGESLTPIGAVPYIADGERPLRRALTIAAHDRPELDSARREAAMQVLADEPVGTGHHYAQWENSPFWPIVRTSLQCNS